MVLRMTRKGKRVLGLRGGGDEVGQSPLLPLPYSDEADRDKSYRFIVIYIIVVMSSHDPCILTVYTMHDAPKSSLRLFISSDQCTIALCPFAPFGSPRPRPRRVGPGSKSPSKPRCFFTTGSSSLLDCPSPLPS